MYYVYIIESMKNGSRYIGISQNLKKRLAEHNNGETKSNKTKIPFALVWYCAFTDKYKAFAFEKYLKSSSGYAFTAKHFL